MICLGRKATPAAMRLWVCMNATEETLGRALRLWGVSIGWCFIGIAYFPKRRGTGGRET